MASTGLSVKSTTRCTLVNQKEACGTEHTSTRSSQERNQKLPTHSKRITQKLQIKGTQPPPQTNPQQDPDEPEQATTKEYFSMVSIETKTIVETIENAQGFVTIANP